MPGLESRHANTAKVFSLNPWDPEYKKPREHDPFKDQSAPDVLGGRVLGKQKDPGDELDDQKNRDAYDVSCPAGVGPGSMLLFMAAPHTTVRG